MQTLVAIKSMGGTFSGSQHLDERQKKLSLLGAGVKKSYGYVGEESQSPWKLRLVGVRAKRNYNCVCEKS